MKVTFTLFLLYLCATSAAQKTKKDLTKDVLSTERKEIIAALKQGVQHDLRFKPSLIVKQLWMKNGFAYFVGHVKAPDGKEIDFSKTGYKEEVEAGVFDGNGTNALLKKTGTKWKVLAFAIGPSDVPWGCWWKTYKAPKEIFDYAEKECD